MSDEENNEATPQEEWATHMANMAIHAHKEGFLNENGLRTIDFLIDNTIYHVRVVAQPSNIIPFKTDDS